MTGPARVLVLDGQTNQALACVRSLGRSGYALFVASHRRRPLAAWSRFCRADYRLTAQTVSAFASMRVWARASGISVVLPLTERSCLLCNEERDAWEAAGITVGCAPNSTLVRAFDKAMTLELAAAAGVSLPPTRMPNSLEGCRIAAEEVGFPCVIKARSSTLMVRGELVADPGPAYAMCAADLEAAVLERRQGSRWPIIQGFVAGRGTGVFALCDHGRAVTWFAHERLRDVRPTGSGSSLRRSVQLSERLRAPAGRLLETLRWHGPAMVEFRDDGEHPPTLMEVNGRFWGSLQLAIAAGVDFPLMWLRILEGSAPTLTPSYHPGVTVRWLWGDVKRLLYILQGRPAGYPGEFPTPWQGLVELFASQPLGTRLEVWDRTDPQPAIGEWLEGARDVLASLQPRARGVRSAAERACIPSMEGSS